jgi:uncharacterized protein (DUF885 family)
MGAASALALLGGGFVPQALAQAGGQGAAPAATGADAQLQALMDRIFWGFMETAPTFATQLGLDVGPRAHLRRELGDYSNATRIRDQRRFREYGEAMRAIPRAQLSERAQLWYDTVGALNAIGGEGLGWPYGNNGFGYSPYQISQQDGAYQNVPDFLDSAHPVRNAEDGEAYLARLAGFATALDQNSQAQREDANAGAFAPGFILETTLGQLRGLRDTPIASHVLVTALVRKAGQANVPGDWGARASAIVRDQVFPALDRQIALVTELRGRAVGEDQCGVWRLPRGADYYAASVRAATTTNMTPEEVHQLGLAQVAEISARLNQILDRQGMPAGAVGARLTALNRDPAQLFDNTDAGRAALLALIGEQLEEIKAVLPRAFNRMPRASLEVVRVPELIQDGASNGYYNSAPFDGSRPARYYINLKDTHDWPRYGLPALTHHEGYPGHHFQISLSQESGATPMLLRLSPFGAYTEGWGLYAEQIADELGVYDDNPLGRAGYLQSQLFRAARLVVDTGLHHKRWNRGQATDYLVNTTGFPRPRTQREIDRYCASPGQACSYKVGHTVWNRARDAARTALGDRFDLKSFHDILDKGALPLTILEQEVAKWVESRGA